MAHLALIVCLLALHTAHTANTARPSVLHEGIAKYYNAGVMQKVARHRGLNTRGYAGLASTPDCGRIGQTVWASINGHPAVRLLQVDCSAPRDRARHIRERLLIEVDWQTAVRTGFSRVGRAKARVWLVGRVR